MAKGLNAMLAEKMGELQKEHADVAVNGPLVLRLEIERLSTMKEMERAKEGHKGFVYSAKNFKLDIMQYIVKRLFGMNIKLSENGLYSKSI
jgi:hypothetical protein